MPVLENDDLRVEISRDGAELRTIRSQSSGEDWLWQGDPTWWSGRAPLLFPVIGTSPQGHVTIAGQSYPMGSHGFTRHSRFPLLQHSAQEAVFELRDTEETRAVYPFAFGLQVCYLLEGTSLFCTVEITNRGKTEMPYQFGFHPAFVWPLPACAGEIHQVVFEGGAPLRMHRPNAVGLIGEEIYRVHAEKDAITLDPALFAEGAMVFPKLNATRFRLQSTKAQIQMETTGLPDFALWQKPGAPFICLEPWQGTAPFSTQDPELEARPNSQKLPPAASAEFSMRLTFEQRRT